MISAVLLCALSCFWLSRACHREDTRCWNATLWGGLLCIQICLENSKLINWTFRLGLRDRCYCLRRSQGRTGHRNSPQWYKCPILTVSERQVDFECWRNNQFPITDFPLSFTRWRKGALHYLRSSYSRYLFSHLLNEAANPQGLSYPLTTSTLVELTSDIWW